MATGQVKRLLRLYPRAWRERYSAEMAVLVEEMPAGVGVAMDLLVGAGAAYAAAIRANRILSSAAAYLHGVCVAVLLQAIAFVGLVLISQRSPGPTIVQLGPIEFASVIPLNFGFYLSLTAARAVTESIPALVLLIALAAFVALVATAPRWMRRRAV